MIGRKRSTLYVCGETPYMKKLLFPVVLLFLQSHSHAQLADSLKAHIDTALQILERHSLYASKVNWKEARRQAYADAAGAKSKPDLFEAIANVYKRLHDKHGRFEHYNHSLFIPDSPSIKRQSPALLKEWSKGPKIKTEMMGTVAYLRMPGMHAFNQKQIDFYAHWFADSVISLAAKKPTAWIIDLRLNNGGNIRPMMAVLAAFLQDGVVSYCLDRNKKDVSFSAVRNSQFYIDGELQVTLNRSLPDLTKAKVFIITGAGTASSGEGVAAIFKERKHTQLIGERTAGFANATEGFVFDNENAYFLITTSMLGNAKKKPLPNYVDPHITVTNNDLFDDLKNDHAVKIALAKAGL